MKKKTYTPGPWNIRNPQIGTVKEDDGLVTIGSDTGKHIATIHTGGLPYEPSTEAKANAALLASAPDMLKALESIVWKLNHNWDDGPARIDRRDATIRDAVAAIEKARGQA